MDSSPLVSTCETTSGLLCPSLGFTVRDRYQEWSVWLKATKAVKVLQNMTYKESLREQGIFRSRGERE